MLLGRVVVCCGVLMRDKAWFGCCVVGYVFEIFEFCLNEACCCGVLLGRVVACQCAIRRGLGVVWLALFLNFLIFFKMRRVFEAC